jgi:acyl phosphate:glycerol-3-phosphate acyltransferase
MALSLLAIFFLSYLIGAIPFGLLFSRAVGKDVRREGSGNIGATNVNRVLGKKLGIMTLFCDVGKGFFPVFLVSLLLPQGENRELFIGLSGLAAVIGHMFPVYLGFRGGKGVATALGVFLCYSPWAILIALFIFVAVVASTGFVSAGSLAAAGLIPFCLWLLHGNTLILLPAFVIAVLIWVKHSSNIGRLVRGEEKSWRAKSSS